MVTTGHALIGLTPSVVDGTFNSEFRLTIHNMDNTDTVWIGNETVTVNDGLGIAKGQFIQIEMKPGDFIYAVSSKTGHEISWMKQV